MTMISSPQKKKKKKKTVNEWVNYCHTMSCGKDSDRSFHSSQDDYYTAEEAEYKALIEAVKNGDNKSKTKLAWFKLSGRGGVKIDEDEAVVLLEERVKDKDTDAMWMLGLCYEYAVICKQDIQRAESLYEQSRDGGNVVGKFLSENGKNERGSGVMNVGESLWDKILTKNDRYKWYNDMKFVQEVLVMEWWKELEK